MEKLHFSIMIHAPKQKVWETMLNDETYRQWTDIFNPSGGSSYFQGKWETGSNMRFIGTDKDGNMGGMISRIKEARPYEFVSIEHLGEIKNGKETIWTKEEKGGAEALENYTLNEKDGGTELLIDIDTTDEFKQMFEGMWPKALATLKTLSEK